MPLNTSDFDFHLPEELIAQQPADRRDESRMMVLHREEGRIEHRTFRDLPGYLRAGDLVVVNDTRVVPARIYGSKATGGRVELLFLEETAPGEWDVLLRARRRPRPGEPMDFGQGLATVYLLQEGELGRAKVRIDSKLTAIELLERLGEMPLPPYIRRKTGVDDPGYRATDRERYQTVYAREHGAVAAPTAGLHFTPEMFDQLAKQGVNKATVTLHVGIGTFRPVTAEKVEDHRMEAERYTVTEETVRAIASTKAAGGRVCAVGSTTVRTLESVARATGHVVASSGRTDIFITPPFTFHATDVMLTNFHLPKSTLIMMVSALAGRELIMKAYAEAVRERYRFFSYGDCMLIL